MGKLRLILSILWQEKLKRLYMSLIIVILIVTSNISISLIHEMQTMDKIVSLCHFENAIYYSDGMSFFMNESENGQNNILTEKEAEKGTIASGSLEMEGVDKKSFDTITCYVYNDKLCSHIELPLQSGNWFSKNAVSDGEVILSSDFRKKYQVGEVIEKKVIDENEQTRNIKLKIIGFLESENNIMDFSCAGTVSISDMIIESKNTMIVQGLNDIEGNTISFEECYGSGTMFFLKDTLTDSQIHQLRQRGTYEDMEKVVDSYQENNKEKLQEQIGIEMVILFLAVSSLGSSNFLTMYQRRKEYGIYFICGMEKKNCILFTTALNGITLLVSIFISLELYLIDFHKTMSLTIKNIGVSVGIIIAIYVISSIPFWVVMRRESPIHLTKK